MYQAANRAADLVRPVCFFVAHVKMPTGTSDRAAGDLHAGAGDIASGDAFLEYETNLVARTVFAQSGDAGIQMIALLISTSLLLFDRNNE